MVDYSGGKFIPQIINETTSTTSPKNSDEVITGGYRGFLAFIMAVEDIAGTLDVKFQSQNPRTEDWFDIPNAEITQLSATGNVMIAVGAYLEAVANEAVPAIIGTKIRAVATLTGTWTYSVDLILVS